MRKVYLYVLYEENNPSDIKLFYSQRKAEENMHPKTRNKKIETAPGHWIYGVNKKYILEYKPIEDSDTRRM